jgi:hypothetical protein
MRKCARLAATAGITAAGLTAMSGVAQADTSGTGLVGGLTGAVGRTVGGLVDRPAAEHRTAANQGVRLSLPVRVPLPAGHGAGAHPVVDVKAPVKASVTKGRIRLAAGLCVSIPAECASVPNPIPEPPPTPPAPPTPPPGQNPPAPPAAPIGIVPASTGSLAVARDALPMTGGPIGTLALIGAATVLTGAASVAGSRLRLRGRA